MRLLSLKLFLLFLYLLYPSITTADQKPDIKNLKIHKDPKKVTDIIFRNSEDLSVSLEDFKDKLVVINFWATWCAPCRREMPSLEKLTHTYPEIKVYAINMEKPNKLKVRDFFRSIDVVSLDTYYDPDFKLVKQFKMRGLPTSILIDKNGDEFGRVIGEVDFVSEDFINLIKKYI